MPNNTLGLTIDPEFRDLLLPLEKDRREGLEALVAKDGFTSAIACWENNGETWIIDGHNRYDIWLNLPDETKVRPPVIRLMKFDDRIDVELWMIRSQAARRNWTPQQRKYMVGTKYNLVKQQHGGDRKSQEMPIHDQVVKITTCSDAARKATIPESKRATAPARKKVAAEEREGQGVEQHALAGARGAVDQEEPVGTDLREFDDLRLDEGAEGDELEPLRDHASSSAANASAASITSSSRSLGS